MGLFSFIIFSGLWIIAFKGMRELFAEQHPAKNLDDKKPWVAEKATAI